MKDYSRQVESAYSHILSCSQIFAEIYQKLWSTMKKCFYLMKVSLLLMIILKYMDNIHIIYNSSKQTCLQQKINTNQFIPFIRHVNFFSVLVTIDNELSKANRFFTCNINKAKYLLATKWYPPSEKNKVI